MPDRSYKPPKFPSWIFQLLIGKNRSSFLDGDFKEIYNDICHEEGKAKALRWYWGQIFAALPPIILNTTIWRFEMLNNYLKIAVRNLVKNKSYSAINITGLAIGMASCILILLYTNYEKSYEDFHVNAENIFRIRMDMYGANTLEAESANTYPAVAPTMKNEIPGVITVGRVYHRDGIVRIGSIGYRENRIFYADQEILDMFSFDFIEGDKNQALSEPNSMVITESIAKKYFGNELGLNKSLIAGQNIDFKVTGIIKDLPKNTHLKFDILLSIKNLQDVDLEENAWGWYDFYTYALLEPRVNRKDFESNLADMIQRHKSESIKSNINHQILKLQPLEDIHLKSNLKWELGPNGNGKTVLMLEIIAYLILAIAFMNFMNLSTARSIKRTKEVGIRKVLGAFRLQLIRQFILESMLLYIIAFAVSLVFVFAASPVLQTVTGKNLGLDILLVNNTGLYLTVLFAGTAVLSGLYPAIFMSSFKPISILKGLNKKSTDRISLRKGLIILQFAFSIFFLSGTLVVFKQIDFMKTEDIGINIEQTLVVKGPTGAGLSEEDINSGLNIIKNEMIKNSNINNITLSSGIPGKENFWISRFAEADNESGESLALYINSIDYNFFEAFEVSFLSGRNFAIERPLDDSASVILNKTAIEMLRLGTPEEALGKRIERSNGNRRYKIVGIIEDINQNSLKKSVQPNIYLPPISATYFISLKINSEYSAEVIAFAEKSWKSVFPEIPFDHFFLDEFYNSQYKMDEMFGNVFGIFSTLALFIAALGLFGLSAFAAETRIKEIGIRKVLGATSGGIISLLLKDFLMLILWANLIAWPIAYIAMNKWLQDFAYRIDLDPLIFGAAGFAALVIALLTISYQSIKASFANPVESLRYE